MSKQSAAGFAAHVSTWNEIGERVAIRVVGCGKIKASERMAARDLYRGDLTRKRITISQDLSEGDEPTTGTPYLILSAKHGLVGPLTELDPYEQTIATINRPALVERVRRQIEGIGADRLRITVEAGSAYLSIVQEAAASHPDARVSPGRVTGSVCRAKQAGRRILDWHDQIRRTA